MRYGKVVEAKFLNRPNRFIAEVAAEEGYIAEADIARLIAFRDDPSDESWIGK